MSSSRHLAPWARFGLAVAGGYVGARALEVAAVRLLVRKALMLAATTVVREALLAWREQQQQQTSHGARSAAMH
jgi:hypothetical protein